MIITTKLYIPRPRTALVTRHRLIHRLHEGLNRTLTLVIAPAGYGKTTLLSEWTMTVDRRTNDPEGNYSLTLMLQPALPMTK